MGCRTGAQPCVDCIISRTITQSKRRLTAIHATARLQILPALNYRQFLCSGLGMTRDIGGFLLGLSKCNMPYLLEATSLVLMPAASVFSHVVCGVCGHFSGYGTM